MLNTSKLTHGFIDLMLGWPKTILLVFLLLVVFLGLQARDFTIDASPDTLLTRDNTLYAQTQQVNQRFAPQEFLLVTYAPHQGPLISESTFAAIRAFSEDLMALERVESVRSILNVPVFPEGQNLLSADIDFERLTIESGDHDISTLREAFRDHPIYENLLVNEDLSATAMQVLFRNNKELEQINARITELNQRYHSGEFSPQDELELARLEAAAVPLQSQLDRQREEEITQIRGIIERYNDDADIHLGGGHVLVKQLIDIISADLLVFGAAIAIGICLLLLVFFRMLRWLIIPGICCLISVLSTVGLFAMLDIKVTVISSNFIALQLILTLAIVMHLIVQFRELARQGQHDQRELIRQTLLRKIGPCFFAGITTAIGFGSLVFSGLQPVIAFGWMMIIAMFVSIAVSLVLFPVILELMADREQSSELKPASALVNALGWVARKHPVSVIIASLLLAALSVSGLLLLNVENSFINYFRQSTVVYQELAYIDQEFGGTTPLDLTYTPAEPPTEADIIMSAETVQTLQLIQHTLAAYEATGRILSPVNLTDLARQLNGDRPLTEYELTAAYWMMEDSFREDLIGAFYDVETGQTRINIWIQDLTEGLNREQFLEDIRADMAAIGISEEEYQLSNLFILYQDLMQQLYTSQILTLGLVYLALTLTFLLIFRSLRIAIAAIIPNILSTLAVLGIMGWLGIPLDLMTITIAAIAMGIAVDDTIHFIHRYLEERNLHGHDESVRLTHASVGIAIFYTSLLIAAGFSMLGFSDFVPSILFGLLTALCMVLALLTGLCLLPVLLRWLVGGQSAAKDEHAESLP